MRSRIYGNLLRHGGGSMTTWRLVEMRRLILLVAVLAGAARHASAEPISLPPAQYTLTFGHYNFSGGSPIPEFSVEHSAEPFWLTYTEFAELAQFIENPASIFGHASVRADPVRNSATALLSATTPPDEENSIVLTLAATTQYSARVVARSTAPSDILTVPYLVSSSGAVNCAAPSLFESPVTSSLAYASASVGPTSLGSIACGGLTAPLSDAFSTTVPIGLRVGETVGVFLTAGGNIIASSEDGMSVMGAFDAWVDPIFTIDPAFAYASDFELVFSPGLTSPTPVPEPSFLVLVGIAAGGAWFRNRRRYDRAGT
jgi:hypothetical protein